MFILIGALFPILAGIIVYRMLRQDLQHTQSIRKLKRGAVSALIQRHRRAIQIHLAIFLAFTLIYLILLGTVGVVFIIIWLIVFMGHMQALSHMSKRMMGAIEVSRMMDARLADMPLDNDMIDIDYENNKEKATLGD